MCASFRVFSLNFEGDKLSPWPFFKGTIPIAVRDWRNGAAWLKPCSSIKTESFLAPVDKSYGQRSLSSPFKHEGVSVDILAFDLQGQ